MKNKKYYEFEANRIQMCSDYQDNDEWEQRINSSHDYLLDIFDIPEEFVNFDSHLNLDKYHYTRVKQ